MQRAAWAGIVTVLLSAMLPSPTQSDPLPPGYGEKPKLPPPRESWLPTINWSVANEPWVKGQAPKPATDLRVVAFAQGLKHPRWLLVLPNGDVLVAEAASEPSASWWPRTIIQNMVQRRSGSIVENANRISLLRDKDQDGVAEERFVFLEGLRQPFGMALVGDQLYVANTDSVVRFPYRDGDTHITDKGTKLLDLPVGHHWTRALLASTDQSKLFITVGSGSNIGEKGMDIEKGRATILELDLKTGSSRIFASGLRNANGMAFEPTTGALWTVVNERDELGDDVPPDYLTSVKDGGFYGWPYSYWGKHVDTRVQPQRPDLVATAITPDYALGGHTASLGLGYYGGTELPAPFQGGMFIGQHGSWNRSEFSGYKVVFVPFKEGRPAGPPIDVLTGFIKNDGSGTAQGRPVGVAIDRRGALLVADDTGNTVWRITGDARQSRAR
jgi:glucose/arabinose dehydrogenase